MAVDFSPRAKVALAWIAQLVAGMRNASVHFVHAIPLDTTIVVAPPPPAATKLREKLLRQKLTRWLRSRLPRHVKTDITLRDGFPVDVIMSAVRDVKPDLLVMTTRGRYGLARLLKGSITEQVVRKVRCPVMILHDPAGSRS
ncbi:MAG: hypothetical protein A2992_09620 [Elusimicrobia bacterium RIFCSPLOWO2_01_FULL_59_12]|nr:MAG: hypothetical protein A2992_09620 [Elusimicrobia bacterium RIFCSPLOWO2_01_FULL_59_12]